MVAIILSDGQPPEHFERVDLQASFVEDWLQTTLAAHPQLLPMEEIDPSSGKFIPLCRELRLPKLGSHVSLDLLGVTPHGRLVLIECKLWRNPQARREVVAQILEYASLLRRWSYSDLTERVSKATGRGGLNPLYEIAREGGCVLSEAVFCDTVARSLRTSDFHLIIAGDGIREDTGVISTYIADMGVRLALIEVRLWRSNRGNTLITSSVPFRSEVIRQRVLVDLNDAPLPIEYMSDPTDFTREGPPRSQQGLVANRAFWQQFIDEVRFDNADQAPPRHGGNNWVQIMLPAPAVRITAYRHNGRVGLFLVEQQGSGLAEALINDLDEMQKELPELTISAPPTRGRGARRLIATEPMNCTDQLEWLKKAAVAFSNMVRVRL